MKKYFLMMAVAGVMFAGCAKKQILKPEQIVPVTPQAPESKEEPSIRYDDWTETAGVETVYFDYDSSDLTDAGRTVLKTNAEYLKSNPGMDVLVEGHCDERGTVEYNLALGQRRAAAVREYYITLGIPAATIGTISYGKERPAVPGNSEAAWAKDRRAVTKVRNKK
jgi:peptidoglycan-associated lipoprotein